jgi:hypothetical protein
MLRRCRDLGTEPTHPHICLGVVLSRKKNEDGAYKETTEYTPPVVLAMGDGMTYGAPFPLSNSNHSVLAKMEGAWCGGEDGRGTQSAWARNRGHLLWKARPTRSRGWKVDPGAGWELVSIDELPSQPTSISLIQSRMKGRTASG